MRRGQSPRLAMSLISIHLSRVAVVAIAIAPIGCQKSDQIRSYDAPKEATPPVVAQAPPAEVGDPTDRMLAAILPDGGQAWFFKVVGPIAAVAESEKAFNEFLTGVRLAPQQARPEWKLPEGWTEKPASAMRVATLVIPAKEKPLEVSVTMLPWSGTPMDLLNNVNRWRDQMQLPNVAATGLGDTIRELPAGDAKITLVDLRGRFKAGSMTSPFAGGAGPFSGGAGTPPAMPTGQDGNASLPPGHPPIDSNLSPARQSQPNAGPAAGAPQFTAPASWQSKEATGMRKAAFDIVDGDRKAEVTVMDFAANAGMADPLSNVNRWRREVGLPEVTPDKLPEASEALEVDGKQATLVVAIPDAADPAQSGAARGTLAAMVPQGNQIWFFKLTGSRDLVAAERENFLTFLKSVRFSAEGGTGNGNK